MFTFDEEEELPGYADECDFSFSNMDNKNEIALKKPSSGLKYRLVYPGLNLRGTCNTSQCVAYGKRIWIKKGFGEFDINSVRYNNKCPECGCKVKGDTVTNFGFRKAAIQLEGVKVVDDEEQDYELEVKETQGKLITFEEMDHQIITWGYLKISVKKLG